MRSHIRSFALLCISLLLCLSVVSAHESMIMVGFRGGAQTGIPTAKKDATARVHFGMGGTCMVDCRYTFYGTVYDYVNIGATIGMGIGFGSTALRGTNIDMYRNIDYRHQPIDYTVHSTFRQTDLVGKAEWSVLFAMNLRDVVINIGAQYMFPFAASSKMRIKDAYINAYYPQYGVDVRNERITGFLDVPAKQSVTANRAQSEILVAAEVGYQWHLDLLRRIGVQGYAYVGVWNNYRASSQQNTPLVQVEPILDVQDPIPSVTINGVGSQISGLRHVEVGVKVFYSFTFYSYQQKAFHAYDTRSNHNRFMWR